MPLPHRYLFVTSLFPACAAPGATVDEAVDSDETGAADPRCEATGVLDDVLTVADVQALASHNSYHIEPPIPFDDSHRYTHPPLDVQADLGVRSFELDLHRGEDGVFQVFHLPLIDAETTCSTLTGCLSVLRAWSVNNPCHAPFVVWIEPKDDIDADLPGLTTLSGYLPEVDAAVLAAWPRERILTPDDVRAPGGSVSDGLRSAGWPLLAASRGKLILALLDDDAHRDGYLEGAADLAGRLLFVNSDSPDDPNAATFKINNAASESERVEALVSAGFLVTSNAATGTPTDEDSEASWSASVAAGPHHSASDHVEAQADRSFVARLEGGSPRCHPTRVPDGCGPEDIEPQSP